MKRSVKEVFEIIAESYDRVRKKAWPNLIDFMNEQNFISNDMLVLDLGCANGRHTKFLEKNSILSIGMDISLNFIKIAKKNNSGKRIQYLNSEISTLPFKNNIFSHVICIAALHHLKESDRNNAIREMFRVLKPGGSCLFTVWIRDQERFLPILLLDLIFCNFLRKDKKYGDVLVPWRDQDKKNEDKQFQLLLYKQYFSEQYGIPLDKIEIEFFIVKRKVLDWDDEKLMSPHQAYRVQTFTPPSGKIKLGRATKAINDFINECFNSSGKIKDKDYPKSPSKWNCNFCPYKEDKENCGEGIIY